MRFAYADPPYIGQAKKHYADEAAKAGRVAAEVDHAELVERLTEYDGWALSLSSPSLKQILALCPDDVRVAAWTKPFAFFKPWVWPTYAWEPVIFRRPKARPHLRERPTPFDWVRCNPLGVTEREREHASGVKGRKPQAFCFWLFDMLDMRPEDELHDLFPGSGGVTAAWDQWRQHGRTWVATSGEQLALEESA